MLERDENFLKRKEEIYVQAKELKKAIDSNDAWLLSQLLASGLNVDAYDKEEGVTSLIYATKLGKLDFVKILVEAGASLQITDYDACTAGTHAASMGNVECLKFLLSKGAEIEWQNCGNETLLEHALISHNIECIRVVLAAGANINACNNENKLTPLMHSVMGGNLECVKELLFRGAKINCINNKNQNALQLAQELNNKEWFKTHPLLLSDEDYRFAKNNIENGVYGHVAQLLETAHKKKQLCESIREHNNFALKV